MSELGRSSSDTPRSMDVPGRVADTPFTNHAVYGSSPGATAPGNPYHYEEDEWGYDLDEEDYKLLLDFDKDLEDSDFIDHSYHPDPNADTTLVEKATAEVRRAIEEIEATESAIADGTGRQGEELAESVDKYLVDHAEYVTDTDASDKEEVVEAALVEGALEVVGDRPKTPNNPIIELEKDGYGQQVVDGVEKMHEEGAILPDGESAAAVVARTVDAYEGRTGRPDVSEQLDTALQYYFGGASKEEVLRHTGVDPKEITRYVRSLPPDEREYAIEARRKALGKTAPAVEAQETSSQPSTRDFEAAYVYGISQDRKSMTTEQLDTWFSALPEDEQQQLASAKQEESEKNESIVRLEALVEKNLETSAPELLKGRLPQELAERIGSEYVLGLRQLGCFETDDAQEKLDVDGGVNVAWLDLVQSFNVIKEHDDDWTTKGFMIGGYYGVRGGGKFVIAIPAHGSQDPTVAYNGISDMRRKARTSSDASQKAVNPKYVAGFIDGEGVFHPNENFMLSDEPKLANAVS